MGRKLTQLHAFEVGIKRGRCLDSGERMLELGAFVGSQLGDGRTRY